LPLLVLFDGGANDAHNSFALDDTALLADFLDGCSDFHGNRLFVTIDNATFREVVGGQLNGDKIPGKDANIMHADLARDVRKDCMAFVLFANQLDFEGCVGKGFQYLAFYLDDLFGHKRENSSKSG
jgi:hypothetical protein